MNALDGIRLLELTHMVSGPYAGMILADLGAETIKVEPPGQGDMTRPLMTDDPALNIADMGPYFLSLNRNKKSVTLNLKSEAGRELFYELVRESDIVLNNYRAGVVSRLQIDHDRLANINPRIVTCSITGFGETGPDHDQPSYDMVAQAMSGVMSITGPREGPPTRVGFPVSDMSGSVMSVAGVLAALVARQTTGRGQHVDIALLDAQISTLNYMATISLMSGKALPRMGSAHAIHVPYDVYACQDGHIILGVVTDAFWLKLTQVLDLDEIDHPANQLREGRIKNRQKIDAKLGEIFRSRRKEHWLERLRAAGIPCGPVHDLKAAFAEPQVQARGMVVALEGPEGQPLLIPGNPIKLSETPGQTFRFAPQLGEHNQEVFGGLLGKSQSALDELRTAGVI